MNLKNLIVRMKNVIYVTCAMVVGVLIGVVVTQQLIRPAALTGAPIGKFEQQYPGFFAGPMVNANVGNLPDGTLVTVGKQTVTQDQVDHIIAAEPEVMQKRIAGNMNTFIEQIAQSLLINQELTDYAAQQNIPSTTPTKDIASAYQADLIKNTHVNDSDVEEFYKQQTSRYGGNMPPLDMVRDQIRQQLTQQAAVKKLTESINRQAAKCTVNKKWVEAVYKTLLQDPDVADIEKLRQSGKPFVLVFAMNEPKMTSAVNQQMSDLSKQIGDKANTKVVSFSGESFALARYRVRAFWVTIVFNNHGREVYRTEGQIPSEELVMVLKHAGL